MNIVSAFTKVASGACVAKSVQSICANLANPWAMACAGARVMNKYATALSSGGLGHVPKLTK